MKKQIALYLIFSLFASHSISAKIWINECMQSNVDGIIDDLRNFPDSWVELYNDSDSGISLQNWSLSDQADYTKAWKIKENTTIPAHGFVLIYCDKEALGMHTDFRLDSGKGGAIYLFNSNGDEVDSVKSIPKQPAPNIAWGRLGDGGNSWAYFVEATPNKSNTGPVSDQLLPAPVFSHKEGIYKNAINLTLSLPENAPAEATLSNIYYTLDGSEPTSKSTAYNNKIVLSKTTPVKAKLIVPGYLVDRAVNRSYIISSREMTLPIISLNLDPKYLWDDEFGIYVKGNGVYGKTGNGSNDKVNWNNDWRRPMNVEYFPSPNDTSVINQLGELRIAGGWSRGHALKSLILYTNKRFGEKRFDYRFFPTKPDQEIKSIMLRNSGNDFGNTYFRDAAIQHFMGNKTNLDYQAYQPAIIYLNGEYYGIENLRERTNEDYVFANYNGLEEIDMIEKLNAEDVKIELKTGDWIAYDELMAEIMKPLNQINYEKILRTVDTDEFMNYMILEIFIANTDFPHNNVILWRPRTDTGKWRFIVKDTDFGLGISQEPTHNSLTYNLESATDKNRRLFVALMSYTPFKEEFYDRFMIYMGDILSYKGTSHVIDSIQQIIEPEMPSHRNKWRGSQNLTAWYEEINKIKTWCSKRNDYVYNHLASQFGLGTLLQMTITSPAGLDYRPGNITVNEIPIQYPEFNGKYYRNKELNIQWKGDPAVVNAWTVSATVLGRTTNTTYYDRDISYVVPDKCSKLKFTAIHHQSTALDKIPLSGITIATHEHQVVISGLADASTLTLFDMTGRVIYAGSTHEDIVYIPLKQKGVY
ncbi:MAG: CotH kinase family protein, partial [Mediterranea sp.]|nr:CotH kinase family protein [Mediterranea sp.]